MITQSEPALAQFQEDNCVDCVFADTEMLGKGACCTYPAKLRVKGGACLARRPSQSMTPAQARVQLKKLDEALKEAQVVARSFAPAQPHYKDATKYVNARLSKLRYTVGRMMTDLPGGNHGH